MKRLLHDFPVLHMTGNREPASKNDGRRDLKELFEHRSLATVCVHDTNA